MKDQDDSPSLVGSHVARDYAFDDDGEPTGVVQFAHEAPEQDEKLDKVTDALWGGLDFILNGGHRDAAFIRAAAFSVRLQMYPSQDAAAEALGVKKSALSKALSKFDEHFRKPPGH